MSDQNKNTERLRAILQEKMAKAHAAEADWNMPSDEVWVGLSNELQAEKPAGRSGGLLYLFAAISIALMAVLLMRECSHTREIDRLKSEKIGLENSYLELKENCDQNTSTTSETSPPSQNSADKLSPSFEQIQKPVQNADSPLNVETPEESMPSKTPNGEPLGLLSGSSESQRFIMPSIPSFNLGGNIFSKNLLSDIQKIPASAPIFDLPQAVNVLPISPIDFEEKSVSLNLPENENGKKGLVLVPSLHAAFSLTGNRLVGETPDIIVDQKALPAYRAGVGLEAVLSPHLSVETGLEFSTYRIQTDYQLEVAFTHENEYQHDDGGIDNTYNHSLPSSMGNYPAQFVLTRADDAVIHEGEVMNLDLRIRQRSQFLSLPLHFRYAFGKSRLRAAVKTGLVANRLLEVSSEMPTLVSHHSEIHQRHTSIGDPLSENLEKSTLDVSFGLDLRYHLSPRVGVSLETNYQRGVTPIYKDENVKNYLDAGNVGVGLHFLF